jgi:hypothetical protein
MESPFRRVGRETNSQSVLSSISWPGIGISDVGHIQKNDLLFSALVSQSIPCDVHASVTNPGGAESRLYDPNSVVQQ